MINSRFKILHEIGSGGIGRVFKAVDRLRGDTVALKVLLSQESELVERFKKEFLLLRGLQHPNIVNVYDFGSTDKGEPFFTMEYVEAKDWKTFLLPLDYAKLWPLLVQVCSTLDFLHSKQIIHRDLKPSNILVTDPSDGEPIPKFTDFGFAEYGEAKEPAWWKGTLSYLAPEVIRGEKYGCQADLYSLGVLIYETVFGKRPFDEESPSEIAKSHLEKEVIIPDQPPVSEGLKSLIMRLLEKDPIDRCFSAKEILDEVKAISGLEVDQLLSSMARSSVCSGDFVGREENLSVLTEALKRASAGEKPSILLSGESGVGKTRLLQEFKSVAQLEGAWVVDISAPSRGFLETLKRAGLDLLDGVSRPAVLIVEHLEDVDDSKLELLRDLVHHANDMNALVCMSITNGLTRSQRDRRASQIEKEIGSSWRNEITRIRLENLSEEEAKKLVNSLLAWKEKKDEIAAAVHMKTKGNPLLIQRLLEGLVDRRKIRRTDGQWLVESAEIWDAPIPQELAKETEDRLGRLNRIELDLLSIASVLGMEFETDTLRQISGIDRDVLMNSLENILAERILVRSCASADDEGICFLNGFTRDFIYEKIDRNKTIELHGKVGRHLEEKHASETRNYADQLAHHFYQARDDRRALKYALQAAQNAESSGRTVQAINEYLRVLELYDRGPVPLSKSREDLYCSLAGQYEAEGNYEKSLEYFTRALDVWEKKGADRHKVNLTYRRMARIHEKLSEHEKTIGLLLEALSASNLEDSTQEHASILVDLARNHRIRCEYDKATGYLQKAISMLRNSPVSREMGVAFNCMAGVHWSTGDYPKAFESLSKSLEVFQKLGEVKETAECHAGLGLLLRSEGRPEEALGHSQKAREVMESLCDPYSLSVFENNLALIYIDLNRWNEALECLSKSVELKEQISDLKGLALSYNNMGLAYLKKGLFSKSTQCLAVALELFQAIRDRSGVALVYYNLGDLHRCKGEWRKALHYSEKSLKMGRELGEEGRVAESLLLEARIAMQQSNFDLAAQSLNQAVELFSKSRDRFGEAEAKLTLGEVALKRGNLEQAGKILGQVRLFTESLGSRWLEGCFDKVYADWLKARGDPDTCLAYLLQACSIFKELGARYEFGKTYLEVGKLKLGDGRIREARALLREARNIFEKGEVEGKRKETEVLLSQIKDMGQAEGERVQTLYRLADLLNLVWDTDELLSQALDLVIELLNAERGAVILYSARDKTFELKISRGLEQETSEDAIDISRRVLTDVVESDTPLIVENAVSDQEFAESRSVKMHNILSILCVPLKTKNRLIGTVYLDHRSLPAVFSSQDIDFLKAFANLIAVAIEKSELYVKANEEIFQLKGVLHNRHQYPHIIGNSAKMQEIFSLVERIADSKTSVLIHGESGTGKELIAHLIHMRSQRRDGPFVRVNCAALPETLLESELFGIEEKAATGVGFRKGKFELADGGAIFLDEIGDMSLSVQAKVLRVLQEREFERVGGQKPIKVGIRVISATNMDLQKKVEEGTFRKDLYYRLNTIVIDIPPLRERKEDIPYLVQHYAKKFSQENRRPEIKVTRKTIAALQNYSWPGNVRELEHLIESATLLSKNGEFPKELLPEESEAGKQLVNLDKYGKLREVLDWVEKRKIIQALEKNEWNQVKAADELGLNETSLRRRIKKHGIKRIPRITRHN